MDLRIRLAKRIGMGEDMRDFIAEKIPGARYVEMPHCGHIAVRDDPAGSALLIRDFTSGLAANA